MNKSELRAIYLRRRKELSPAARKRKSELIADGFFAAFDVRRFKYLHGFLPIEKFYEIDTKIIYKRLWREFPLVETLAPRVNFQINEIENLCLTPDTEIVENKWRIPEPQTIETIETAKIDAVLVPLLCFDERGCRVGYGKGFYDKFLACCRADCLKIGLSFFAPEPEISDIYEFDIKLDFCVTPERVYTND